MKLPERVASASQSPFFSFFFFFLFYFLVLSEKNVGGVYASGQRSRCTETEDMAGRDWFGSRSCISYSKRRSALNGAFWQ